MLGGQQDITGGRAAAPSSLLLPCFAAPVTERVWLVAAHGGAGCSTIYRSAPGLYADAGRALPVSPDPVRPAMVVLCAMGSARGLESLRALLAEWHAGRWGATVLLGVAVTDCMARQPRVLNRARLQVTSPAPCAWRLPYVPSLPVEGVPDRWPAAYMRMDGQVDRARAGSSVHDTAGRSENRQ